MNKKLRILICIVWMVFSLIAMIHHEIWRDEMRALSIVIDNTFIGNIFSDLKNEGHPVLWYLILKIAYFFYSFPVVLKVVSWLIGLMTILLLLRYTRLPSWLTILYAFSIVLFWENTIMCRNYGISSLLLFAYLFFYRSGKAWGIIIVLVLLIQTNLLSVVVAWLLFLVSILYKSESVNWSIKNIALGVFMLFISTCLFYYTTVPDSTSIIVSVNNKNYADILFSITKSFILPVDLFRSLIGDNEILNFLLSLVMIWCLISRKILAATFWILISITQFFYIEVYALYTRHLGILISFFIVLLDIGNIYSSQIRNTFLRATNKFCLYFFIPAFLIGLGVSTVLHFSRDYRLPSTSNKELALLIKSNSRYKNSLVMADADYIIEGLPYYLSNNIYLPREECFRKYAHFTTKNRNEISIADLIRIASMDSTRGASPALFICNQKFRPQGDTLYKYFCYSQLKVMHYSPKDLIRIRLIKDFNSSFEDENYTLYEIN